MSVALGVPHMEHRPTLQRSRSHTDPSHRAAQIEEQNRTTAQAPKRPSHVRSRSYLSPIDPKPRNAVTLPSQPGYPVTERSREKEKEKEKHHRLHLPGKHRDRDHESEKDSHHRRRHRYTQSDHLKPGNHSDPNASLPSLVAGLNAERNKRTAVPSQPGPGTLTRMMSTRSYRGPTFASAHAAGDPTPYYPYETLRLHATHDAKSPLTPANAQGPARPYKTPIELDLEHADRIRRTKRLNLTAADVRRRDAEIEAAEDELRGRIDDVNRAGMEITRRLDYGYYNLLEKVGNLVSTIQGFQGLSAQSGQLVINFEKEATRVDEDTRRRVKAFKKGFEEREERVRALEERGRRAGGKAEELQRRLENASIIVRDCAAREVKTRKVWGRFWGGVCWSCLTVFILIMSLIVGKEWWFRGDPVKAGLRVPQRGHVNHTLGLGDGGVGEKMFEKMAVNKDIPEEVCDVLKGIEERNRRGKKIFVAVADIQATGDADDGEAAEEQKDSRLRVLDEL